MWVGSLGREDPLEEDVATHSSILAYILLIFLFLSVDGHLGCFHVLVVVNSAAMNIGVHVSFSIMIFSGYMPSSGIAGSYGSFIPSLFFFLNLCTVLHMAVSIYIPINCARMSPFLHILSSIYYL